MNGMIEVARGSHLSKTSNVISIILSKFFFLSLLPDIISFNYIFTSIVRCAEKLTEAGIWWRVREPVVNRKLNECAKGTFWCMMKWWNCVALQNGTSILSRSLSPPLCASVCVCVCGVFDSTVAYLFNFDGIHWKWWNVKK